MAPAPEHRKPNLTTDGSNKTAGDTANNNNSNNPSLSHPSVSRAGCLPLVTFTSTTPGRAAGGSGNINGAVSSSSSQSVSFTPSTPTPSTSRRVEVNPHHHHPPTPTVKSEAIEKKKRKRKRLHTTHHHHRPSILNTSGSKAHGLTFSFVDPTIISLRSGGGTSNPNTPSSIYIPPPPISLSLQLPLPGGSPKRQLGSPQQPSWVTSPAASFTATTPVLRSTGPFPSTSTTATGLNSSAVQNSGFPRGSSTTARPNQEITMTFGNMKPQPSTSTAPVTAFPTTPTTQFALKSYSTAVPARHQKTTKKPKNIRMPFFATIFPEPTPPSPFSNVIVAPPLPVEATAPSPPNWQQHYDDTNLSLSTHKRFQLDTTSQEFKTILKLLHPTQVISAEQIVNPDVWQRYVEKRKEMIRGKTDDLSLLSQLGLDAKEIQRRSLLSTNFAKDSLLTSDSAKYSPNETLLFHCTRSPDKLNKILSQGLDERLSSTSGGRLGKGIYFADNPQKALKYDGTGTILIFAVLLGDCLSINNLPNKSSLVREPEKEPLQKRTLHDQFFDSITATPKPPHRFNEYVIFNRHQCCPLYLIRYHKSTVYPPNAVGPDLEGYVRARQTQPTVAWRKLPTNRAGPAYPPMPNQTLDRNWPFFAANVFKAMTKKVEGESDPRRVVWTPFPSPTETATASSTSALSATASTSTSAPVDEIGEKMGTLLSLGFLDEAKNKAILTKFKNNLDQAVNFLLDNANNNEPLPSTSATASSSSSAGASVTPSKTDTAPPPPPLVDLSSDHEDDDDNKMEVDLIPPLNPPTKTPPMEECSICFNEFESFSHSPQLWKELNCTHKLCLDCYAKIGKTGTTQSGTAYTSSRCPFCQQVTGIELGDCPDGKMYNRIIPASCAGYGPTNSIEIAYRIKTSKHHLKRNAYLPNNQEGQEVLKLLKRAWDRRITFVIGTSNTTGAQNVPVWNIHHKTKLTGGGHGYPDPGYLGRVRDELKTYGIE